MTGSQRTAALTLVFAAILAAILTNREKAAPSVSHPPTEDSSRPRATRSAPEAEVENATTTGKKRVTDDWENLLAWLSSHEPRDEDEVRERLLATRASWTTLDPQALADAIGKLLETDRNASTGLDFKVGVHGLLSGWPTLRVFLLDVLATSDPEMAMAIAQRVLDHTDSADEFATALRSLTRNGLARAADEELLRRFDQMLGHSDWQTSRGFAEAFDLARYLGTPAAAERLIQWPGNPALKAMALDEFAAQHPDEMLENLTSETPIDGRIKSTLMARANPNDPAQLESVDAYLRHPTLTYEEASAFLKSFPLRSATTGFRLYGKTPSPYTFEQIRAGDLAAEALANTWASDPALENYRVEILSLQKRLAKWNEQSK